MARFQFTVRMRAEPTCAIVGTWQVVNCAQPVYSSFDIDGFTLRAIADATGEAYFYPDDAAEYLTCSAEL